MAISSTRKWLKSTSCLLALLLWAIGGLCQESDIPPDILMVNGLHCQINPSDHQRWAAVCTASYLNHDKFQRNPFVKQFPPRKSEPRANKDADEWLKKVTRIQAVTRPVDVNELLKKENRK